MFSAITQYSKVFLINFLVFCFYVLVSFIIFTEQRQLNPIGTGIMQYAFIFIHLIGILSYWILNQSEIKISNRVKKLFISLLGLALGIIVYNLFMTGIWEWFWHVRGA